MNNGSRTTGAVLKRSVRNVWRRLVRWGSRWEFEEMAMEMGHPDGMKKTFKFKRTAYDDGDDEADSATSRQVKVLKKALLDR
jgi:hypothetical protein